MYAILDAFNSYAEFLTVRLTLVPLQCCTSMARPVYYTVACCPLIGAVKCAHAGYVVRPRFSVRNLLCSSSSRGLSIARRGTRPP